jgi:hypothetical protein
MNYFYNVGIAFDMMLNALLGGTAGQTLSYRAASDAAKREKFWCLFCRLLSVLVQPNHCADQLSGIPMDGEEYIRAFFGLVVLSAILFYPLFWFFRGLMRIV